jgi:membrane dipeptidase
MTEQSHGPWVDVHAHPGRCFLGGLEPSSPFVAMLGGDESRARVQSSLAREVSVVNAATVADLAVLGVRPDGGLFASREFEPGEAADDHDRQLKALSSLLSESDVCAVLEPGDISAASAGAKPGVFISCEGADFLDGHLDGLAGAYADGARSVTLVHYRVNELGDIQTEDSVHGGLTDFGREVVREMNRVGMIVDLAHATFDATVNALEESDSPMMISDSHLAGPAADHPRLLSEQHAPVVAEAGGLIGDWPAGIALETLDDYCEEICRLVDVVGMHRVAIGTDLDANFRPVLTSYEQLPEVAESLGDRGMSAGEVDQILGGNFIDLFTTVANKAK